MRKIYLHTIDKTSTFDLNTTSAFATDLQGFGNAFNLEYSESEKGNHLVNVKPNFDNIQFKVYFNCENKNPYINYKALMDFLTKCGMQPFLIEYNDSVTDKFCEIVVKSLPKSQVGDDGIFAETFVFERQSYWYEKVVETFALKNTDTSSASFPLGFPFGFIGKVLQKKYKVKNKFFVDAPISITISGKLQNNINIYIATLNDEIVQELQLSVGNIDGTTITIEPSTKKITIKTDNTSTNGYGLTDKTKQSFLYLPQGEYYIGSNIDDNDTGKIEISIKKYLLD